MEESTSLNADVTNAPTSKDFAQDREATTKGPVLGEPKRRFTESIAVWARAYGAALVASLVVIPTIASVVTLGLYFSPPLLLIAQPALDWYPVVFGALFTLIVWCIGAVFGSYFTTVAGANARSYGLLISRLSQLEARLSVVDSLDWSEKLADYQRIALREAHVNLADLKSYLSRYPAGLQWVLGIGYVNAWLKLHRADEALIDVEPPEMVIGGALHDMLSLENSQIGNRDKLLAKLVQAANDLDPAATVYFKEHRPDKNSAAVTVDTKNSIPSTQEQARARFVLREVRQALNDFKDFLWAGLVRARNSLLGVIALTGLLTYVLLCAALLAGDPASNRSAIIAATAFYMAAAIAGLFGRVYRELTIGTTFDDYGFSLARLIATPLLSGLAGVSGVLVTRLLYNTFLGWFTPGSYSITLQSIFKLDVTTYLLVAAIFGLLPNLIIRNLKPTAEQAAGRTQSPLSPAEQLAQIYEYDLHQTRQWARISAIAAFLGLLLIPGGVIEVLTGQSIAGLAISVAGGLSEIIAAFSLLQVRKVNGLVDMTSERMREEEPANQALAT